MDPIAMKLVGDDIILRALREDITFEDVSTASVCPEPRAAEVQLIAKAEGAIAGLDVFARAFALLDPATRVEATVADGDAVSAGQRLATVYGDARVLLAGERVALNFLQRMSGIATYTRRMATALEGTDTVLVDTRKTTPCLRVFEKAAVEIGGGRNHRYNLSTAVMLKDNHIDAAGSMTKAVELLRGRYNPCPPIEVECRNLDEISEAVACRVDRIMLDNMTPDMLPEALEMIPSFIETEISGGVSLDTIRAYATVSTVRKPDFISVGRITHSAVTADLSMRIAKESL